MLAGLGFRMAFELQLKQGLGFKVCQYWMSLCISEEGQGGYNQSSVLQLCALLSRLFALCQACFQQAKLGTRQQMGVKLEGEGKL